MNYAKISDTELYSSNLAFGCDSIGSNIDKQTTFKMFEYYIEHGGNHFDTANIYGNGASETTIGQWLKDCGGRDKLIISTKGAHPDLSTMHIPRLSFSDIQSDLDTSLLRLGSDYIDLYWLHRDCADIDVSEIIDTLNTFVKQGKIKYFGCSNWRSERISMANKYADSTGQMGFCASQIKWSLAKSSPEYIDDPTLVEMNVTDYEYYKQSNLAVFAYASQAKGFFSKMQHGGADNLSIKSRQRYYCEDNIKRFESAKNLALQKGVNISSIILSYLKSQPFPVIPIIGCSSLDQLRDSMKNNDLKLSSEELMYLQ